MTFAILAAAGLVSAACAPVSKHVTPDKLAAMPADRSVVFMSYEYEEAPQGLWKFGLELVGDTGEGEREAILDLAEKGGDNLFVTTLEQQVLWVSRVVLGNADYSDSLGSFECVMQLDITEPGVYYLGHATITRASQTTFGFELDDRFEEDAQRLAAEYPGLAGEEPRNVVTLIDILDQPEGGPKKLTDAIPGELCKGAI